MAAAATMRQSPRTTQLQRGPLILRCMPGKDPIRTAMMRASDRDRDQVVGQLRAESVEGRVSQDELERRLERALAAETIEELAAVVADLPALPQTVPQTTRSTAQLRLGRSGIRPFILQLVVAQPVGQVRAAALDTAAGGLIRSGFEMTRQTPATLEFLRTRRQGWFPDYVRTCRDVLRAPRRSRHRPADLRSRSA